MSDGENSQGAGKPKRRRGPGRPFAKGQSGNPRGRAPIPDDVKEAARGHTLEALERLAYWMRSSEPGASVRATEALLNRAWGTPTSSVEMSGPGGEQLVIRIVKPGET